MSALCTLLGIAFAVVVGGSLVVAVVVLLAARSWNADLEPDSD